MAFCIRPATARRGGVYLAVLGTSLIVSVLGLSAIALQQLQNRRVLVAEDIRQAQLNAEAAVELGLLAMSQDDDWRSELSTGTWFSDRDLGAGTCSLNVAEPIDGDLDNDPDHPITMLGVGDYGDAEQRVEVTVDPVREPLGCLRWAVAVGDDISLNNDVLRTTGPISAADISISGSTVIGNVEAEVITGSGYTGSTEVVDADDRPQFPDWPSVFDYYKTNGTEITIGSIPTSTPNLGRNVSFDSNTDYWTGEATGLPTAWISRETDTFGHAACLRVYNRADKTAGASQYIDHLVEPGAAYNISVQVYHTDWFVDTFRIKLSTKGTGTAQTSTSSVQYVEDDQWQTISATLTAPSWSGDLEYARITIDTDFFSGTNTFYIDNVDVREATSGRIIYRQVLSPGVNPFGGGTNSQGIYWIDCGGNTLLIHRSRIVGTLLLIDPGAGSGIGTGPVNWKPAVAGYPALMVDGTNPGDGDLTICMTDRALSEADNGVNFNPSGASHSQFGSDADLDDIYPSEIRGLVVVESDLDYHYAPLVRGAVIVADDINSSSGTLEVEYEQDALLSPPPGFYNYRYDRRPASVTKSVNP